MSDVTFDLKTAVIFPPLKWLLSIHNINTNRLNASHKRIKVELLKEMRGKVRRGEGR